MSKSLKIIAGAVSLAAGSVAIAAPSVNYTAGTVAQIAAATPAATPANSGITDATYTGAGSATAEGTGLTAFNTLMNAAYTANTGGVMNFEQVDEGGGHFNDGTTTNNVPSPTYSWPSQPVAGGAANGVNVGIVNTNAVQVNYGASQPTSSVATTIGAGAANTLQLAPGTNSITFYRDFYTASGGAPGGAGIPAGQTSIVPTNYTAKGTENVTQSNALDGFDSNNGLNVGSSTGVQPTSGNAYFGITNDATPVVLDFTSNPLSAFGINAINRGGTNRPLEVAVTLADGTVLHSDDQATAGTGNAIFYGFALTPADLALHGGIVYGILDTTGSGTYNRFDDLAFIVAPTPEPASLGLLALGGVGLLRRRRA